MALICCFTASFTAPVPAPAAAATPCLYTHDGQWTYEVCYKRHVRQFRQVSSNRTCGIHGLGV
jgi:hypothetical protein